MVEKNTNKIEREYVIPLREKCRSVPSYRKTPKAIKSIKEFLARHMKVPERNLDNIRIDRLLNEAIWNRGIKNPIHKIKVKAIKEGDIVRVYAVDLPTALNYKKSRLDKKSAEAKKIADENKKVLEKAKKKEEEFEDKNANGIDDKVEEKEKAKANEEAEIKSDNDAAKKVKHTTKTKKTGEPEEILRRKEMY